MVSRHGAVEADLVNKWRLDIPNIVSSGRKRALRTPRSSGVGVDGHLKERRVGERAESGSARAQPSTSLRPDLNIGVLTGDRLPYGEPMTFAQKIKYLVWSNAFPGPMSGPHLYSQNEQEPCIVSSHIFNSTTKPDKGKGCRPLDDRRPVGKLVVT